MREPKDLEDATDTDAFDDAAADVDRPPYFHFQVFDLKVRRSLLLGRELTELGLALDETLAGIAFPGSTGFVTVCYWGTGCWANDGSRDDFFNRRSRLDNLLKSIASKAIGDGPDSPMGDGRPVLDDDHGNRLWLYVFLDKSLDSRHRKVDSYERLINQFLRNPVPSPVPPPPPSPPVSADQRSRHLDALLATVPKDAPYEEQARQGEALRHAFNQGFAVRQGEAIKAEMLRRGQNAATHQDKLKISRWANRELRRFRLAFTSAKTGIGIFTVDHGLLEGRFTLKGKAKDEDGKTPYLHTKNVTELVEKLAVVEAPPRREGLAERIEQQAEGRQQNHRG